MVQFVWHSRPRLCGSRQIDPPRNSRNPDLPRGFCNARWNRRAKREMLECRRAAHLLVMGNSKELIWLRSAQIAPNKDAVHPFDIAHGTSTGGYLSPREIVTGHQHDAQQYGYSAIAPSVFREITRRWRTTLGDPERGPNAYSFVDIGAGKGRALLLASELPFRKVIGVELSAELAAIAQDNAKRWSHAMKPD